MKNEFLERLVVLLKEDKELHDALVDLLVAKAASERAMAEWRNRR